MSPIPGTLPPLSPPSSSAITDPGPLQNGIQGTRMVYVPPAFGGRTTTVPLGMPAPSDTPLLRMALSAIRLKYCILTSIPHPTAYEPPAHPGPTMRARTTHDPLPSAPVPHLLKPGACITAHLRGSLLVSIASARFVFLLHSYAFACYLRSNFLIRFFPPFYYRSYHILIIIRFIIYY